MRRFVPMMSVAPPTHGITSDIIQERRLIAFYIFIFYFDVVLPFLFVFFQVDFIYFL